MYNVLCNIIFFIIRTFVKKIELVNLRAFSPRPVDFHLCPAPPRGKKGCPAHPWFMLVYAHGTIPCVLPFNWSPNSGFIKL